MEKLIKENKKKKVETAFDFFKMEKEKNKFKQATNEEKFEESHLIDHE